MSIPLRCRFGWHNWPRWSEMQPGQLNSVFRAKSELVMVQDRTCPDCGRYEIELAKQ